MSNSDSSSQGFVDRVQSFVTENKRAILIGTALAVAAGGVALYASTSSSPKPSRDKKDKKKSGKSKPRDVESGPIIEELPVEDQPSKPLSFVHFAAGSRRKLTSCLSPSRLWCSDQGTTREHANRGAYSASKARCSGSNPSLQERTKLAAVLKKKGNDFYQKESFELAAEFYTRAINVSPTEEPVYYSNRGACECTGNGPSGGVLTVNEGYTNMKPPKFDLIIEDCDKAISLNKDYVKAINRRANALEALDRLEEALRGWLTALVIHLI